MALFTKDLTNFTQVLTENEVIELVLQEYPTIDRKGVAFTYTKFENQSGDVGAKVHLKFAGIQTVFLGMVFIKK